MSRGLAALVLCSFMGRAAAQSSTSFEAQHTLGEFYISQKQLSAAVPYLAAAYKLDPANYDNAYDLALAYLETGALENSRQVVQNLIKLQNKAELHNLLGEIEEKSGHVENSAREYETAARMDPSEKNLFDLGNELLMHRGFEPALTVLAFATQKYPQSAELHVALGVAFYSVGRYDDALNALCRAVDLNPKDMRAFDFLGKMYDIAPAKADEVDARLALFVHEYPGNAAANFYYALSLRRRSAGGKHARNLEAEKYLQTAGELKPQWADPHYQLGMLYEDESQTEQAIREYAIAARLSPQLAKAHYRLARLYEKQGRTQLAQTEFRAFEATKKTP